MERHNGLVTNASWLAVILGASGLTVAFIRSVFLYLMRRQANLEISITTREGARINLHAQGVSQGAALDLLRFAMESDRPDVAPAAEASEADIQRDHSAVDSEEGSDGQAGL
jgi:Effector Associated Constant Component 1